MRAVVCAYGEVGHACLGELLALGTNVALVVTHEDSPNEKIWFSSVRDLAVSSGVEVVMPDDVNAPETLAAIRDVAPEYLFSFYFRQMMGPELLALPSRAALNMHGSLLPKYRGRAPVNWVLVNGEAETGVTLHHMDEKPDHGGIVSQRRVAIGREDTAQSLTQKLAAQASMILREVHPQLYKGTVPCVEQNHSQSTYFGGRRPADGRIDWSRPAEEIRNLVRAVTDPWPGAFSHVQGRKLLVWAADTRPSWAGSQPGDVFVDREGSPLVATGDGALELLHVTWDGESRRSGREWAQGAAMDAGARFDDEPQHDAAGGGI
ncbi:MAG: formyltransferase [Candidatus Binatia bacterium]|nr:formyltransferase [Candidatus Binatia bacterium]